MIGRRRGDAERHATAGKLLRAIGRAAHPGEQVGPLLAAATTIRPVPDQAGHGR